MKRKLQNVWKKMVTKWPWMSKKEHGRLLSKQTSDLIDRHEAREREITKRIDAIVERGCTMNWQRDPERQTYQVTVEFDPRMLGYGGYLREELRYIAKAIGYQVEAEIATSRFIKKANDHDYERWKRERELSALLLRDWKEER